ncbi:MAG: hypothetical protein ACJ79E_01855 [Anaeromyxobacteraceae bacterium]
MKLAAIAAAALCALAAQYAVLIRPSFLSWGATAAELEKALPGDERWPAPAQEETRAITIAAPPARVWPWIAQLGQDRAGFYSYRALEDLVGCEMPEGDRLLGLADPRPGERIWFYPPRKASGRGYATYAAVEPGRSLVLATYGFGPLRPDGSPPPAGIWSFTLEPDARGGTRLLVRGRSGVEGEAESLGAWAFRTLFFEPVHFAMERKMLLGIRDRAEGRPLAPPWRDLADVVAWALAFALGLGALGAMLVRRRTFYRPLLAGTAALFALTVIFFAAPPLAITAAILGVAGYAFVWALEKPRVHGHA